ncbi:hypothetical protein [Sphingomicrobium sediminis]|uniref:Uncharacterized protein n=1 Tax=Sphingomicrobium sediminis TaxID=2950949 RepID=A0A9X2J3K8_9SPHN|nr:hypothetical protein [Sphingomicrobium sediminis]MCM8557411.1 hypothetical protein [Sphingomicrobium sediminis]
MRLAFALAILATPLPAFAQGSGPAVGGTIFVSSDADGTDILRVGADFDIARWNREKYRGIRVERAHFAPGNSEVEDTDLRVYARIAEPVGEWKLAGTVGTDGDDLLGSITAVHDVALRKEFFLEREIVETPIGLTQGLMSTYGGLAVDIPADDLTSFTLLGGVQAFTGDNTRYHLRANAVRVVDPDNGISIQLRARYFTDTTPREYDYYAPGEYLQLLPVVQVQRFNNGWRYRLAGGWGALRDSDEGWRQSRYAEARLTSPDLGGFSMEAQALYAEQPTLLGGAYSYGQFQLSARTGF